MWSSEAELKEACGLCATAPDAVFAADHKRSGTFCRKKIRKTHPLITLRRSGTPRWRPFPPLPRASQTIPSRDLALCAANWFRWRGFSPNLHLSSSQKRMRARKAETTLGAAGSTAG